MQQKKKTKSEGRRNGEKINSRSNFFLLLLSAQKTEMKIVFLGRSVGGWVGR